MEDDGGKEVRGGVLGGGLILTVGSPAVAPNGAVC